MIVYKDTLISTIVDPINLPATVAVYKDTLISTIVDTPLWTRATWMVYKDTLISTIVDATYAGTSSSSL